jgi:STE24 endopeptidase
MESGNAPVIDPARQAEAQRYARIRRRLFVLNGALGGTYLLLWLVTGSSLGLRAQLSGAGLPWTAELILFTGIVLLPWVVLSIPFGYYSGFVLPHRFGLSTQSRRGWLADQVKAAAISLAIGLPLFLGLYALIHLSPEAWWLWAAVLYTLVGTILAALAPILLMPVFFKFKPLEHAHADLAARLVRLAERAGTYVQGVFTMDLSTRTRAANAALVGIGRTRRILLGDTLLDEFTHDEITGVLAHELGHHAHHDIPLSLAVQSGSNLLMFYLGGLGLARAVDALGLYAPWDPAGFPALALIFALVGVLTLPALNAFSRWRETLADEFALEFTDKPGAFADALVRLANQNLAEVNPERWVVWLMYSHPPLGERIERARNRAGPGLD